jgi:hypothetical protein
MDRSMRIRINDFLARNESPAITGSRVLAASASLHGRPGTGSATLAPAANERGKAKNSDLTGDYGISVRQTQCDHLGLS